MASDAEIREAIKAAPIRKLDELIGDFIHDERNQEIARRKILWNERFEPIAERFDLTPRQCRTIIKQARRTIYEHL